MSENENGFVKIPNELLDKLTKCNLGNAQRQIFDAIIRQTFGWHKEKDEISINRLSEMTGVSRRMVIYSLQNLEAKHIIIIKRKRGAGIKNQINTISIQTKYDLWVVQEKCKQYSKVLEQRKIAYKKSKELVVQENISSARNGNLVVQETVNNVRFLAPIKDTITKDTITKEKKKFGEHVLLTENEYSKLVAKFGKVVTDVWIEKANIYAEKIGVKAFNKKYVSHYATILTWDTMKKERDGVGLEEPKKLVLVDYKGRKVTHKERLELERKEKENEQ